LYKKQHIFQKSNHLLKVLVLDILIFYNLTSSDLAVKIHSVCPCIWRLNSVNWDHM